MPQSDTHPEIAAMQNGIVNAMTGEQRLLTTLEVSHFAHELARQGIRDRHPDWTEEQVRREFFRCLFEPGRTPTGL